MSGVDFLFHFNISHYVYTYTERAVNYTRILILGHAILCSRKSNTVNMSYCVAERELLYILICIRIFIYLLLFFFCDCMIHDRRI